MTTVTHRTGLPPYRPNPLDTSTVEIPGPDAPLEALVRNAHEVWAQLRMNEGWRYGPTRDDVRKLHPCLIPFEEMPDSDRSFDREMVLEILKAAILLRNHVPCD